MSEPRNSQAVMTMRAVLGVAVGRADALGLFLVTPRAFIASLLPLVIVPVLNGLITHRSPTVARLVLDLLTSVAALLVPPVLTHALAVLWGREPYWLRFAIAFNWCQLGLLLAAMTGLFVVMIAGGGDLAILLIGVLGIYALWLHWFLARHALGLPPARSAMLVLGVHAATTLVVLVPRVVAAILRAPAAVPS